MLNIDPGIKYPSFYRNKTVCHPAAQSHNLAARFSFDDGFDDGFDERSNNFTPIQRASALERFRHLFLPQFCAWAVSPAGHLLRLASTTLISSTWT